MDRPAITPIQDQPGSDEPHAKRQAQLAIWTPRRTRVTQACDLCRERKRQCDYLLPRCGRCQKVNKDCTFLAVQKTRGRPLGSSNSNKSTPIITSQPADNKKRSESSISTMVLDSSDNNDRQNRQGTTSVSRVPATGQAETFVPSRNDRRVNRTFVPMPVSHSLQVPAQPKHSLLSPSTSSSLALSSSGASLSASSTTATTPRINTTATTTTTTASPAPPSSSSTLATVSSFSFSKEVIDHLVSIFFEHVFYYFNFFDPLSFLRDYDQGVADPYFLDAVCALASRFSTHPDILQSPPYLSGEPFAARARSALSQKALSEVSMTYLHTALLLSFYEYTAGHSLQGYHFGGMACRMASELQLHRLGPRMHHEEAEGEYSDDDDDNDDDNNHRHRRRNEIDESERRYNNTRLDYQRLLPLFSDEALRAYQVKSRTFLFIVIMDHVAAVTSGLSPAIDTARYQMPDPPSDNIGWWVRREGSWGSLGRHGSSAISSAPILAPTHELQPLDKATWVPLGTKIHTNTTIPLAARGSNTSPLSSSTAHPSTQGTQPAMPSPSLSWTPFVLSPPLSVSSPSSPSLSSPLPTVPSQTTDKPPLSPLSESLLQIIGHPVFILGREPFRHYSTLIPVSSVVVKFVSHGGVTETDSTMMMMTTTPSTYNTAQSNHTNNKLNTDTITDHTNKRNTIINLQSVVTPANTTYPLRTNSNNGPSHPSQSLLRTPKRRRESPLFASRERRIEFEKADKDLKQWAEQLPEEFRPWNAVSSFTRLHLSSLNLSFYYYLMVMVLHRPILITNIAASRRRQGEGGGGRDEGGEGDEDGRGGGRSGGGEGKKGFLIGATARKGAEMEGQVENKDDNNEDDVRKNLNGKGNENEYGLDDDAELRTIERSKQRCIEAATAVVTILEIFEDEQVKYHGGHHAFTVYFAGTILILHLSMTKDLVVQSQIHERLQVCFRFFAILGPYWEDAAKKAQILRDLLTSQARDRQGGVDDDENDGRDEDDEDQDQDEDDGGSNDNDNDSVDDHGAEQSLQDLMIADALLDLSNRPPRQDYHWRRSSSGSSPVVFLSTEAPPQLPPISSLCRPPSGSSLLSSTRSYSECRRTQGCESKPWWSTPLYTALLTPPATAAAAVTAAASIPKRMAPYHHPSLPPALPVSPQQRNIPSRHPLFPASYNSINLPSSHPLLQPQPPSFLPGQSHHRLHRPTTLEEVTLVRLDKMCL